MIFDMIDTDKSGFIEFKELAIFLEKLFQKLKRSKPTKYQVAQLFYLLDTNEDTKISFNEIKKYLKDIDQIIRGKKLKKIKMDKLVNNERLLKLIARQIFDEYDVNKNGFWEI